MTQEWMIKSLIDLGLARQDAQVYVYIALAGPKIAEEVANALRIRKENVQKAAARLQELGLLAVSSGIPTVLAAVSFDVVLDQFVKANVEKADRLEREKDKIVALWRSSIKEASSH